MATPEPEQSKPVPADQDVESKPPAVCNTVSASSAGSVVQAGVVHGDIHLHPAAPAPALPRQLPASPGMFTGRATELAELDHALTATFPQTRAGERSPAKSGAASAGTAAGATVVISAIGGAGGIGKTWLVVRWAHTRMEWFPDGQLFVDLRGFSPTGEPMSPAVAVRGFLDTLGIVPDRIPVELEAQAALYRSLVADKRMLIVLDNAATVEQVAPLLPGGRACTVVVTSRRILTGLIARHGAHHLNLDVLTDTEARALLERRLGAARMAAEPRAVAALLGWCRGFPLALGLLAGRAQVYPGLPLAQLAAELRESSVDALDDDDPAASLPVVLATSHRALTLEQQHVFGLLGIAPGPDISLAAASLTGLSAARIGRLLRDLRDASLLYRDPHDRYSMHDLIRSFAATTAHRDLPDDPRDAALDRVVDFYLHTAHTADRVLSPHREPIRLAPPVPGAHPRPLSDAPAALAWLDTEHACLLAAQHTAALRHHHQIVSQLAGTLITFHQRRGHRHDDLAVWRAVLEVAAHLPDPTTRALAHRRLGHACSELGRHEEAIEHLCQALALAEHHHDPTRQAHVHQALARAWERRGDDRRALTHARRALALYQPLDQPIGKADALNSVGWHASRLGEYGTARAHCQEALTLYRQHHAHEGEANTLDSLGFIDHHTGRHQQAVHHYRQALTLFHALGNTVEAANTLDRLGHPHAALGRQDQARAAWGEALELYRQQGRDTDAERVQRRLDSLDHSGTDHPGHDIDS